jgi:hypothetical protein
MIKLAGHPLSAINVNMDLELNLAGLHAAKGMEKLPDK